MRNEDTHDDNITARTALKTSDTNRRSIEKEAEVEEMFGRSSLSFRVDQVNRV